MNLRKDGGSTVVWNVWWCNSKRLLVTEGLLGGEHLGDWGTPSTRNIKTRTRTHTYISAINIYIYTPATLSLALSLSLSHFSFTFTGNIHYLPTIHVHHQSYLLDVDLLNNYSDSSFPSFLPFLFSILSFVPSFLPFFFSFLLSSDCLLILYVSRCDSTAQTLRQYFLDGFGDRTCYLELGLCVCSHVTSSFGRHPTGAGNQGENLANRGRGYAPLSYRAHGIECRWTPLVPHHLLIQYGHSVASEVGLPLVHLCARRAPSVDEAINKVQDRSEGREALVHNNRWLSFIIDSYQPHIWILVNFIPDP